MAPWAPHSYAYVFSNQSRKKDLQPTPLILLQKNNLCSVVFTLIKKYKLRSWTLRRIVCGDPLEKNWISWFQFILWVIAGRFKWFYEHLQSFFRFTAWSTCWCTVYGTNVFENGFLSFFQRACWLLVTQRKQIERKVLDDLSPQKPQNLAWTLSRSLKARTIYHDSPLHSQLVCL